MRRGCVPTPHPPTLPPHATRPRRSGLELGLGAATLRPLWQHLECLQLRNSTLDGDALEGGWCPRPLPCPASLFPPLAVPAPPAWLGRGAGRGPALRPWW